MPDDRIVSSDSEELILVDCGDNEIGYLSKDECHDGDGVLHRAFSLFVFNAHGELLLQKRSAGKRLWPLFWSNSVCSHPRKGESMDAATHRRLRQELDIEAELEFVYKFPYQAQFGDHGSENELCSVYLARTGQSPSANPNEIAAVRYIAREALEHELVTKPDEFTPWFRMEWERLCEEFAGKLAEYAT
ncbi:MAG: isopentenyl-diphosphate Delta-isomerase [Woeseia sp.]